MMMLSEYRCLCGFRTIFLHKFIKHAQSCAVFNQRGNKVFLPCATSKSLVPDAR